jgi:hypothetical protein
MARAIRIAKWNVGQFWNQIHPSQPFLNHGLEFPLQYVRYAQCCLQFHYVVLLMVTPCSHGSVACGDLKKMVKTEQLQVPYAGGLLFEAATRFSMHC